MYCRLMFDKEFKLSDDCAQGFIYYTSPPGRRSAAQMTPSEAQNLM